MATATETFTQDDYIQALLDMVEFRQIKGQVREYYNQRYAAMAKAFEAPLDAHTLWQEGTLGPTELYAATNLAEQYWRITQPFGVGVCGTYRPTPEEAAVNQYYYNNLKPAQDKLKLEYKQALLHMLKTYYPDAPQTVTAAELQALGFDTDPALVPTESDRFADWF